MNGIRLPIGSANPGSAIETLMARYEQPRRIYTGVALTRVMMATEQRPDCDVSQQARRIAALLALTKKGH